jgi:hypothetical protein
MDTFAIFEQMKAKKYPFVILLFLLTVFTYIGHGIHDFYHHETDKIENTSSGKSTQGSIHQEPTQEDETHSILPGNRYLIENNGCNRFAAPNCFIPPKLDFPIWLPPELT